MQHYYAFATAQVLYNLSEEKQKAAYDCITALIGNRIREEHEKPQQPPQEQIAPYQANKTMKLLGMQYIFRYINAEVVKGLQEIAEARQCNKEKHEDLITDVFMYGYIRGKKAERAKKKSHLPKPTK